MRSRISALVFVVVCALLGLPSRGLGQDLFVVGGRLVDPVEEEVREAGLLVRDGKIVGFPETAPEDFAGEVVDAEGAWVIPGLHDLHTHSAINAGFGPPPQFLGPARTAKLMLYAGVTGFLDLFSAEDFIFGVRDRQRRGEEVPGADIFAAGPCLTATDGHCTEYPTPTRIVDTPEDARREVSELAEKRPDVVKVVYHTNHRMPTVDVATLRGVVTAATEHDLPTVVHIGSWEDARQAVLAGATAITHTPEGELPRDLLELIVERGTTVIPTLTAHCDLAYYVETQENLERPLLRAVVAPRLLEGYAVEMSDGLARYLEGVQRQRAERLASVRRMAAAGVRLLTGTDAGNQGVFQGYSVHRELALFVEAGLTPWQALRASTSSAGRFLGRDWGLGVGAEGTLVLLEASPIEDIRNTERILEVIQRGVVVDRQALLSR